MGEKQRSGSAHTKACVARQLERKQGEESCDSNETRSYGSSNKKKLRRHSPNVDIRDELSKEVDEIKTSSRPLPDPRLNVSPDDFLKDMVGSVCGYTPLVKSANDLDDEYFPEISDAQIAAYSTEVVTACRENDIGKVKQLWHDGQDMGCCNRFGESLLHLVCRRGFTELGRFLLDEVGLSVRIRDDCGRTPFHDVLWNPKPQVELAQMLLKRDPSLLLIADKRNYTPFQYGRPQNWPTWRQFLYKNKTHVEQLGSEENKGIFSS
uniref:Uncharacterized protein n=1 Tax=Grammatophora oceanica TaxID=210454 RepID=A0A6U5MLH5_9STRA|mmetsp:Transcript_37929/g.56375  ORF Transcript_37929/g.56375 Transcript_37929/m.56375 type:complete len:265 (+) Transcript_37929:393-1187(+)